VSLSKMSSELNQTHSVALNVNVVSSHCMCVCIGKWQTYLHTDAQIFCQSKLFGFVSVDKERALT